MQEADGGVTVGGYQVKIFVNKHCDQVRLFVAAEEKVEGTALCTYVYGCLILKHER
jgi:hypothetical protein